MRQSLVIYFAPISRVPTRSSCSNTIIIIIIFIIIIIILESAVQGRERVRTLYQSKDPNPTQPTHGRKKKIKQ